MLQYILAHSSVILGALLAISEALALLFPNAGGILKAISLLKSVGAKDPGSNA